MIEHGHNYLAYRDLKQRLRDLETQGIKNPFFRVHEPIAGVRSRVDGKDCVNFASYDYLGLVAHPAVARAAKEAIDELGTSVSASRASSGERRVHRQLEQELADWLGTEDCIVFVGGHATNVTTLGHLFGPEDLILSDALIHNSLAQGCVLSGAARLVFPHLRADVLDRKLARHRAGHRQALILIEGLYSMDGDVPDLPRFLEVKKRHGALLMVDEAHSMGVLGASGGGIREHFGVAASDVELWMGTLSKSLAGCGGYIAGSRELVDFLKYTAPGFLYSVGITPQNAAASLAALRVLRAEPERVARLAHRARLFLDLARAAGLDTGASVGSSVIPVIVGDDMRCILLSEALFQRGISVQPMLFPVAPRHGARLRFFITSEHTETEIRDAIAALSEAIETLAKPAPVAAGAMP